MFNNENPILKALTIILYYLTIKGVNFWII